MGPNSARSEIADARSAPKVGSTRKKGPGAMPEKDRSSTRVRRRNRGFSLLNPAAITSGYQHEFRLSFAPAPKTLRIFGLKLQIPHLPQVH